jgi:hypothetical protein
MLTGVLSSAVDKNRVVSRTHPFESTCGLNTLPHWFLMNMIPHKFSITWRTLGQLQLEEIIGLGNKTKKKGVLCR